MRLRCLSDCTVLPSVLNRRLSVRVPVHVDPCRASVLCKAAICLLQMPLQNGSTSCDADDSSETSPAVLDEDAEVRSCTIYNSNLANGRAGE